MEPTLLKRRATEPFRFSTKAGTLAALDGLLTHGRLCAQTIVAVSDWSRDREGVVARVLSLFPARPLAVRSSSPAEDTAETSNAGAFLSLTDVPAEPDALDTAIARVAAAYGADDEAREILVQPMVRDIALSGVVMTRDLDTGSPYYVINYDDFSGRTDTVTGGGESKTVYAHRNSPEALHSPRMQKIIAVARELEAISGSDMLDIEFCVTTDIQLYVLQVRPITAHWRWQAVADETIGAAIEKIRNDVSTRMSPDPGLAGGTTIFGEMPDWNPAEMIGNAPRRLAYSLYRHLITDAVWADARARMGYKRVDRPLMTSFGGRPYIDVRASLNSFLPANLEPGIADRLIDRQIRVLADNVDLHDKIEFAVAITCRDLGFAVKKWELTAAGLAEAEIDVFGAALHGLTARALQQGRQGLDALLQTTNGVLHHGLVKFCPDPLERARRLLETVIESGTLPFSILARHAFIGVSFLHSMVDRGILSPTAVDEFMRSIHTVAADVVLDMAAVSEGTLAREMFLDRHGHLRPGTYDIQAQRYDQAPDLYLGHGRPRLIVNSAPFVLEPNLELGIDGALSAEGYNLGAAELFAYIATAIAAREKAKYAFSRGISDALETLAEWGTTRGLTRADLANLDIATIFRHADDTKALREAADEGREAHRLTRALRLPHLIVEADDLAVVRPLRGRATFITNQSVSGPLARLLAGSTPELEGCIVLIKSADPGYDWIFSHNIAGLITQYGGANSHMAIRCAEFGLPAAIGCGEKTFEALLEARVVLLNCASRNIEIHR